MKKIRKILRTLKWELRVKCGSNKFFFYLYFLLFWRGTFFKTYKNKPDIVIEGFGGSANSYMIYAFESAQDNKVEIVHHYHVPYKLIQCAKNDEPGIVIIRNPRDAIISLMSRDYYPSIGLAFRHFYKFYKDLIPFKDKLIVATFDEITQNLPGIIKKVNEKYTVNFKYNEKMCENGLDKLKNEKKDPSIQALPNRERVQKKSELLVEIESYKDTKFYNKAFEVYNYFSNI